MADNKTTVSSSAKVTSNEKSKAQEEELKKLQEEKKEADAKAEAARKETKTTEPKKETKTETKKTTKKNDSSDELIDAGVAFAASALKGSSKKGGFLQGLIVGVLVGGLVMFLVGRFGNTMFFGSMDSASSHDEVLENNGILGYTAADFQDAVLGAATEHAELVVMEQPLEITTTLTKAGLANLSIFSKVKTVTYYGTGVYTVNLKDINKEAITVDEDTKTVNVSIPHTTLQYINPDLEQTQFEDTEKGLLAFGDLKLTMEEQNELEKSVKNAMSERLNKEDLFKQADEYAKLKTWQIFQPLITSVSAEYKVNMVFVEK